MKVLQLKIGFGTYLKILEAMGEKSIEKKLRERVKAMKGLAIKFFVLMFAGFPDRIVLMPGGRIWFVELKSVNKKPTPLQLSVHGMLRKLGFEVWVIDTNELLDEFLNRIAK
jgi:hypothetical protein